MIAVPGNVRVWLATGYTDMRRGFPSLALHERTSKYAVLLGAGRAVSDKPVGKREYCGFVGLERDLLSKHHVAGYQRSFENETPPDLRLHFSSSSKTVVPARKRASCDTATSKQKHLPRRESG